MEMEAVLREILGPGSPISQAAYFLGLGTLLIGIGLILQGLASLLALFVRRDARERIIVRGEEPPV